MITSSNLLMLKGQVPTCSNENLLTTNDFESLRHAMFADVCGLAKEAWSPWFSCFALSSRSR
jgi:hypothetical protein